MKSDIINSLHTKMIPIFSDNVRDVFENSLVSLGLFGSVARRDYKLENDIDIFITFEDMPKSRKEALEWGIKL